MSILQDIATRKIKLLDIGPYDNFEALRDEVIRFVGENKGSQVSDSQHNTNWAGSFGEITQHNLLHPEGKYDDCTDNSGNFRNPMYPLLSLLLHDTEFNKFSTLPEVLSCRINTIHPNSGLNQHKESVVIREVVMRYESRHDMDKDTPEPRTFVKARFHLPIVTNDKATYFLDGDVYSLEAGRIYYFNNSCVHMADNYGTEDRISLVWDLYVSKELAEWMQTGNEVERIGTAPIDKNAPRDKPEENIDLNSLEYYG